MFSIITHIKRSETTIKIYEFFCSNENMFFYLFFYFYDRLRFYLYGTIDCDFEKPDISMALQTQGQGRFHDMLKRSLLSSNFSFIKDKKNLPTKIIFF